MKAWFARLGLSAGVLVALGGIVAVSLLLMLVYRIGYRTAQSLGEVRFARYQTEVAQARSEAARVYAQSLQAEMARADAASTKLLAQQADIAQLTDELQKRVSYVSTVYVDRPGATPTPLPDFPFTGGWVHDYNAALGLRMPGTGDAARASAQQTPGAGTAASTGGGLAFDALARSRVTQADVLTVHHTNARICRDAIAQLHAILDLYEGTP